MSNELVIAGSGGKGGGGGGGAKEAPDSLRSKQFAKVLDLLGEGEYEGLVNGLQSVYLNGTPLQNADASFNFKDVNVAYRYGTQTQEYLPGFSQVESETIVGTEVLYATAITRSISNSNVNAVRVTITIPQLTNQDTTNGNLNGSNVEIAIDLQTNGGGFVEQLTDYISGKTVTTYQRSYRVNLTGTGPWDVRVRRISVDSASASINNKTYWASYTEIIDQKLKYPNSVVVGISIDASQFDAVPSRAFDVKMLRVKIPSNYFPLTRTYTRNVIDGTDTGVPQVWDGSFYIAWTDNPAWCWYDLVTSDRYGLGKYIDDTLVDKWAIYTIGKYCDGMVPDGFGGMEPRFTCNLYIQAREEAYTVINSLSSIFRGMSFWSGGGMTATHDAPADPIALFNASNVVNGRFNYSGSSKKARHTVVLVTWNDPTKEYRQEIEYVEDPEGILRYGLIQTEIVAVGCTSRGQAHRIGKWILYTEKTETEIISFKTGLDGSHLYPGAIITTQDYSRSGKRLGGRLLSASTSSVTIDADIEIAAGKTYTLSVVLPDGTVESRAISNALGFTSELLPVTAFSAAPQKFSVWVVSVNDLNTELWRVVSLSESNKAELEVTAIEYHPQKFDLVEFGVSFEPAQTIAITTISTPPSGLTAQSYLNASNGLDILVSWSAAEGTKSATVLWRKDNDNYETAVTYDKNFTIKNASIGTYKILVSTVNAYGTPSTNATLTYNVVSAAILPDVTGLALKQPFVDQFASFVWNLLPTADDYLVEVVVSGVVKRQVTVAANWFNYHYADSLADGAGTPFRSFTLQVKAKYGTLVSGNWATIVATNDAPPVPAATITAITGGFQASAPLPTGSDYAGMQIWASTATGFTPGPSNLVYDGVNNSTNVIGLTAGVPYYVRIAFYDVFGKTSLNISGEYSITPLANVADIPVVAVLPAAGNEGKVVYLTTDDKLYRDNGTSWVTWVDGSDILASSITAGKINVINLSALSASMGTITSGNVTIDTTGFIRGGSTGYLTGAGFWMGYHTDRYKFHIGDPTGQFLAWTGTNLTINGGGTFSGALSAASGTFAGSLSAATGTFSGSLTASAVNAVNTINLAGNAVTIPTAASSNSMEYLPIVHWGNPDSTYVTVWLTSYGGPIFIQWAMSRHVSSTQTERNKYTLRRNGIALITVEGEAPITYHDTPGAGSHAYSITYSLIEDGFIPGRNLHVNSRCLFLLETKR